MKEPTINIHFVTPPVASTRIDNDLIKLTQKLTKKIFNGVWQGGGILGGEFGYGVNYENDVFIMHTFCWCDKDACPWCFTPGLSDTKLRSKRAKIAKKHGGFFGEYGHAPNFYYKKSKFGIVWYKWIGRDMEFNREISDKEWKQIYGDCIKSFTSNKEKK